MKNTKLKSIIKESFSVSEYKPGKLYRAVWRDTDGREFDSLYFEVGHLMNEKMLTNAFSKKYRLPDDIYVSNKDEYTAKRKTLEIELSKIKQKLNRFKIKFN